VGAAEEEESLPGDGNIVMRIPRNHVAPGRDFQINDTDLQSYGEFEHALYGTVEGAEISIDQGPWIHVDSLDEALPDPCPPYVRERAKKIWHSEFGSHVGE
jgi:hypothetical protein